MNEHHATAFPNVTPNLPLQARPAWHRQTWSGSPQAQRRVCSGPAEPRPSSKGGGAPGMRTETSAPRSLLRGSFGVGVRLISVAAAMALVFVPDSGGACSPIPPPCRVDVVPNYKVPANIPGFWWRTTRYGMEVDPSSITLSRRENGSQLTTVPVTIDLANQWIRPGADLSPGEYTMTIGGPCSVGDSGPLELFTTTITVVPPAPLPDAVQGKSITYSQSVVIE